MGWAWITLDYQCIQKRVGYQDQALKRIVELQKLINFLKKQKLTFLTEQFSHKKLLAHIMYFADIFDSLNSLNLCKVLDSLSLITMRKLAPITKSWNLKQDWMIDPFAVTNFPELSLHVAEELMDMDC